MNRRKQREIGVFIPPKHPREKVLSKKALKRLQKQQEGGPGNQPEGSEMTMSERHNSDDEEDEGGNRVEDETESVNTNPHSTVSSTTYNYTFSDTISIHSATSSMIVEADDN